jgi:hypothetical protein
MKFMIVMAVALIISFVMGLVLGMIASDEDPMEQERDDNDQIEYLRSWGEKRRRS